MLLILFLLIFQVNALVHHLTIHNDDRSLFKIETFGFYSGGSMNITLSKFKLSNYHSSGVGSNKIAFVMRKAKSESAAQQDLEKIIEKKLCLLDILNPDDFVLDISDDTTWKYIQKGKVFNDKEAGLYSLIFTRCSPIGRHKLDFNLFVKFVNPGPNYLSARDAPLPKLYFVFFILFSIALALWCYVLSTAYKYNAIVHNIHYMMAILLVLKCFTLLCESIRYHYISIMGYSELWSIVFYIFALMKGVMLFTVILLIGSGWSLMKSYLNDREKRIIVVVLTLQVIDNIAMVILEETAPGTKRWLTWRDILHLVDLLCCCAILFPIVWSINHLRLASEADGKASHNLMKLQLFRQFYIIVIVYIYFTRIAVYLISASIPFNLLWLDAMFTELATLIFYSVTGYKFQPAPDNPYLPASTEDRDTEFGLQNDDDSDGGFEKESPSNASSNHKNIELTHFKR